MENNGDSSNLLPIFLIVKTYRDSYGNTYFSLQARSGEDGSLVATVSLKNWHGQYVYEEEAKLALTSRKVDSFKIVYTEVIKGCKKREVVEWGKIKAKAIDNLNV